MASPANGIAPVALALRVGDQRVDAFVTAYSDRVFVVITELPGFGTLVHAAVEVFPDGAVEYRLKTLLGDREDADLITLLARRLVETVHRDTGVPLLLSAALREPTEDKIRAILTQLEAARPWAPWAAAHADPSVAPTTTTS